MMITGTDVTGVNYKLFELQTVLEYALNNQTDKRFNWLGNPVIYNRVHKTTNSDGLTLPEVYNGVGEYVQPFFDDRVVASLGFHVNNSTIAGEMPVAEIDLIITANSYAIFGNTNRNMPKAQMQIFNALKGYESEWIGFREGVQETFKAFTGYKQYVPNDMSQWLVFAANFKIRYDHKLLK